MNTAPLRRAAVLLLAFLGIFLFLRYLFPLLSPFFLGSLLALAAEPLVGFLCRRCRLPRGFAAAIGVTGAFALITLSIMLILGLLLRQLRSLSGMAPALADGIRSGMTALSGWMLDLANKSPASLRPMISGQVQRFFSDSSSLLDRATTALLNFASGILSRIPGGALSTGTAIISSYMISSKIPAISDFLQQKLPIEKLSPFMTWLRQFRAVIFSWLKAQLKLTGITFLVATASLFLIGISPAPLWGLLVAVVDAFPVLGTGTVLIPWSLVSFLQGSRFRAFALLGIYLLTVIMRSILEPRLVGKQLGLDPLATLIALYVGFRLFGLPGMLLAPMLAVAALRLARNFRPSFSPPPARTEDDS